MDSDSGANHPVSRGLAFFINWAKRPDLVVFEAKVKDITDTKTVAGGLAYVGIMNLGKHQAKRLRAQYETQASSGAIYPSWDVLWWELENGKRATVATLGFREPAKLELFTFSTRKNVPRIGRACCELAFAGQKRQFEYDLQNPEELTKLVGLFRVGIYGDDDVEMHFTVHVTATGELLDILVGGRLWGP